MVALQEDQAAYRQFVLDALRAGGITITEFRKAIASTGLIEEPELDPTVGDVLIIPRSYDLRPIDPAALAEQQARAAELAAQGATGQAIVGVDDSSEGDAANNDEPPADNNTATKAAERIAPEGSDQPLPPQPVHVNMAEADAINALELWDEVIPTYKGLLEERVENAD